ncbi:MAG: EFR1 family ferrodoxin [Spirochaetales bacterium]
MKTLLYYFTGTGNSLWVARKLSSALGGAEIRCMLNLGEEIEREKQEEKTPPEGIGIIFPVYIWGVPAAVLRFLPHLRKLSPKYLFAVAVNAGQVAGTLLQLQKAVAKEGLVLGSGFSLPLPSNYIPWDGAEPEEKQKKRFAAAEQKILQLVETVKAGKVQPVEMGPLWQRVLLSQVAYRMSAPQVSSMDKNFLVENSCTSCGLCAQLCPVKNITLIKGRPTWNHRCEQCLACLQFCPVEAIQFGKKTKGRKRYHHPEITVQDLLKGLERVKTDSYNPTARI